MLYTPNKKCKNMIWLKINICILMLLHMTMDALWKIRIQKAVAAVLKLSINGQMHSAFQAARYS